MSITQPVPPPLFCFDRYSNDSLITLTETSYLRQDEWPAGGDIKWSEQDCNPRQRCSDLGETLDSGGDAAERCQLVFGGRHGGEPQTLLTDVDSGFVFSVQSVLRS